MRRSPEGDRKALWKMGLNSFFSYDKYAYQQRDFALGREQGAMKTDEVCDRPGPSECTFLASAQPYIKHADENSFKGGDMRRVQGRPQSPWKMEINSFIPYSKHAYQQRDFALWSEQGLSGRPCTLRCILF
jgi:hypothetical protein